MSRPAPFPARRAPAACRRAAVTLAVAAVVPAALAAQGTPPTRPPATPSAGRGGLATRPAAPDDTTRFQGLEWRLVGPFRGGRVTTVAGHPAQPLTFYMGAAGGGVWKTEDAGGRWRNVSDGHLATGSVGAIAIAPGDPNVVYVGMGEAPVRGVSSSYGDGVYRSTDGGKTWTHRGLERTRTISRVIVHPRNDSLVYVAAQGTRWAPSDDRGIYRSTDAGATWKRIHFVDRTSGPAELSIDPSNPRVLYAAYWDHQRTPWFARSGGPGSGFWKTTDGGDTWTKLTTGLPAAMGKVSVAVSPADPERVYALVEADSGGLFRSDDAGRTFRRVNDDRVIRARAWYYIHLIADPQNADVVYVMNAPFLKSIDGGRTFATVPTPHGDNHALWVNPTDGRIMINGNDGGANVSLNGGRTWSTLDNQPTAQFYRVATDDVFPYRLYGGQQDNTSVVIASRTNGPGITEKDWHAVGGCESAVPAFDPKDPRVVYAGCYQGLIDAYDMATGQVRSIMSYATLGLSVPSDRQKYRFNWSAPIITSPHDRRVVYHGGNVLFRTSDGGTTWQAISPDLTRNDRAKQGMGGGPFTNEGAGGEVYGTIVYVAESPHERGVLWVTTDDGLVRLTRDGGATWADVTPPGLGEGLMNMVEVSPHDRATAYVAFTRYKFDDYAPELWRTADYGRTWTRISGGLPDVPARVVREDPVRRNLLYAGTETGVWVSFDGGQRWQSLQRNLPRVPVTDIQLRADGDVAVATEGRAFWILDDATPLRTMGDPAVAAGGAAPALRLYPPRPALRFALQGGGGGGGGAATAGRNPAAGATIHFTLAARPDSASPVRLEILDAAGRVVRTYPPPRRDPPPPTAGDAPPPRPAFAPRAGLNRVVWDLRTEAPRSVPGLVYDGPVAGFVVPPGAYTVRLTAGGQSATQPLTVRDDPRSAVTAEQHQARDVLSRALADRIDEITDAVLQLRDVRDQVTRLAERARRDSLGGAAAAGLDARGKAIAARVDTLERALVQVQRKTFQDVVNFPPALLDHYLFVARTVDETEPPVTQGVRLRVTDLDAEWAVQRSALLSLLERDVTAFNEAARGAGVPAVVVPRKRGTITM